MKKFSLLIMFIIIIFMGNNTFAKYKLTLNFASMDPHVNQMLEIRVIDKGTGYEVGRSKLDAVPGSEFKIELYVLIPDSSYRIDFYVDFNKNGTYDSPPADHVWSLDADKVQGNTELTFKHNTNFSDIEFPAPLNFADLTGIWEGKWDNPTFEVEGKVSGTVAYNESDKTLTAEGQAWGIFGSSVPVSYKLDGTVGPDSWTATFTANDPWSGSITLSNGQITGSIAYPLQLITAEVKGHYGFGQAIFYYHMTGSLDAEEYAIFQRDVKTNTNVTELNSKVQPNGFALYANYPNPFNPETFIQFDVPAESIVKFDIYNMIGKKVKSLLNENKSAGRYITSWNGVADDGRDVASGIYFYRLEAITVTGEKIVKMNKMSLIK